MPIILDILLFIFLSLIFAYLGASIRTWSLGLSSILVFGFFAGFFSGGSTLLISLVFVPALILANSPELRREWVTNKAFSLYKKILPPMNSTEREALEAGDVWWDAELFSGSPEWQNLLKTPKAELTPDEQSFVDKQVNTLCEMIDDWTIVKKDLDMPPELWDYIKKEGFFGMIIPKEYGGLGFSAYAHAVIVTKIATRSMSVAVNVMVPNSLGPAELLLEYGTDQQKQHFLPKLASGDEIPCFGLTSPFAGSDASSIPDKGIVCKQEFNGQETLGISITWDKRYITLAPVATLLGLAFKLYDPDKLLGGSEDLGITVAMIPTDHPGVEIGNRHIPLGMAFQNGTTRGKDVFIPMDWLIGGQDMAGKGWRMLMECLAAGRAISLPSLGLAGAKLSYMTTGAYARIRKQFKLPIGYFEGVQEAMARIGGRTYMMNAVSSVTMSVLDQGYKPSVISAICKYHMTQLSREIGLDAVDVHAGKALIEGPRNYLGIPSQGQSIGVTVEGANILTRNLIIFGQGATRCHPFVFKEMEAARETDIEVARVEFDKLITAHVGFTISNFAKTFINGLTGSRLAKAANNGQLSRYYQHLGRMSAAFAFVADVSMLVLGGELKRKERLSARLGDVLSNLYMASMTLKYCEDHGSTKTDVAFTEWVIEDCLKNIQTAFSELFQNFPNKSIGYFLSLTVFPFGQHFKGPSDKNGQAIALEMMNKSEFRERLLDTCFLSEKNDDLVNRVERAFRLVIATKDIEKKLNKAIKAQVISDEANMAEQIGAAIENDVISKDEAEQLREAHLAYADAILVDEFTPEQLGKEERACQEVQNKKAAQST